MKITEKTIKVLCTHGTVHFSRGEKETVQVDHFPVDGQYRLTLEEMNEVVHAVAEIVSGNKTYQE